MRAGNYHPPMIAISCCDSGNIPDTIAARPLRAGDGVAIVSTSSPVSVTQLDRIIAYLTSRGYRPMPMPGVLAEFGYLAGSRHQRAADLMNAFTNPDVRLILPTTGGIGASQLVDILDYHTIRANPKIFVGLSDPSVLCNSIYARAGLITIHGPTGFNFFQNQVDEDTARDFLRMVSGSIAGTTISSPLWRVARPGDGSRAVIGRVVGGSLSSLRSLVGTPFMPPLAGAILLLEEFGMPWAEIDHCLTHLGLAGVFAGITALIWGVPVECVRGNAADRTLDDLIVARVPGDFPIVTGLLVGHASRLIPMPIGGIIRLDLSKEDVELTFCEDAVCVRTVLA